LQYRINIKRRREKCPEETEQGLEDKAPEQVKGGEDRNAAAEDAVVE
jgi:hypothetical protein